LGLDVTPLKTCTFNCVYCQLGRTTVQTIERKEYVPAGEVMAELADYLTNEGHADHITFSGSGEPTLHSKLGEMIAQAKRMSSIPVAVLTCSALIYDPQVRRELALADVVLPSLDAASPHVFAAINRPHGRLQFAEILAGLKRFRNEYSGKIWLEIMLVKGVNDSAQEIVLLRQALGEIGPDKVHLNTVIRPPAESTAGALSEIELQAVQKILGPPAEVIAERPSPAASSHESHLMSEAQNLIARHPATLEEIAKYLNCEAGRVARLLNVLLESGEVQKRDHRGKLFYATTTTRGARHEAEFQHDFIATRAEDDSTLTLP
jgi:wyosine [tRNA(Phe)-imidazoG37] synthetase (radical SAM superfamily)